MSYLQVKSMDESSFRLITAIFDPTRTQPPVVLTRRHGLMNLDNLWIRGSSSVTDYMARFVSSRNVMG